MAAYIVTIVGGLMIIAMVVIYLRERGLRWYEKQSAVPTIDTAYDYSGDNASDTAFWYITGAYNSGWHSSPGLRPTWHIYGDVHIVEFARMRFDMQTTVDTIVAAIKADTRYRKYILKGSSLGGIIAMNVHDALIESGVPEESIVMILNQTPQCGDHLQPQLETLAGLLRYVRPGPVLNFLLTPLVVRLMFNRMNEAEQSEGTDQYWLDAHMASLRGNMFSLIRDQSVAIVDNEPRAKNALCNARVAYQYTTQDGVVKPGDGEDTARAAMFLAAPQAKLVKVATATSLIPATEMHATYMEHTPQWLRADKRAFDLLGLPRVR